MNSRRMLSTIAAATIGAALLAGCAAGPGAGTLEAPPSVADESYRGLPNTAGDASDDAGGGGSGAPVDDGLTTGEPSARWVERPGRFAITVFGSSSCPAVPTAMEASASDRVTVSFETDSSGECTADMAATTHEFTVPSEASALPLTIVIDGDPPLELVLD
ncbi:hypothetical protein [Marisediminicola sp. LYQ85]|uniref:hypothetical protein n=1 Tax=Marisediminicola sp. LYQ85 TaxID=3391062 RepID=UPI003983D77F